MDEDDSRVREKFHQFYLSLLESYYISANSSSFHFKSHHSGNCFPSMIASDVLALTISRFSDVLVEYESKRQFTCATRILSHIALEFTPYDYPIQWALVFSNVSSFLITFIPTISCYANKLCRSPYTAIL